VNLFIEYLAPLAAAAWTHMGENCHGEWTEVTIAIILVVALLSPESRPRV
jgi:hypothetical protein